MARYYFDVREGDVRTADEIGTELQRSAVPGEARRLLLDIARETTVTADRFFFEVSVHEGGSPIHVSSLLLEGGWV